MKKVIKIQQFSKELIAPCGINCGICSAYLAYIHKIAKKRGKITHCAGCRPRDKQCAWIKKRCPDLGKKFKFCFECVKFPCERLYKLDKRYQENYHMSMIENLKEIKRESLNKFIKNQRKKYKCSNCGGVICIHNKKCYDCEEITSWRE